MATLEIKTYMYQLIQTRAKADPSRVDLVVSP